MLSEIIKIDDTQYEYNCSCGQKIILLVEAEEKPMQVECFDCQNKFPENKGGNR